MKILIVGAGFAGGVFGRLAVENSFDVSIVDKRNHKRFSFEVDI